MNHANKTTIKANQQKTVQRKSWKLKMSSFYGIVGVDVHAERETAVCRSSGAAMCVVVQVAKSTADGMRHAASIIKTQ